MGDPVRLDSRTDSLWDRAAAFAVRHERSFTIGAAIWFWASLAVYARFITLPHIPFLTENMIWISTAYNAIWWGFVRPELMRRKAALSTASREMEAQ